MEGIMTGIKPRERFSTKGMSDSMRDDLKNIQSRVNLIDAFSGAGASPLGDPLTQFLLQTGQNLISGESAGGTKLQEISGATRKPLEKAIKSQQVKDLSRRKIAASLLSKMGTGGLQKYVQQARDAFKFDEELKNRYGGNVEKYALELFNQDRFRQSKAQSDIDRESDEANIKSLLAKKDRRGNPELSRSEAILINSATKRAKKDDKLADKLDPRLEYIPAKAEITATTEIVGGKERPAYKPKAGNVIDFQDKKIYFETRLNEFLIYSKDLNLFFPITAI